MNDVSAPPLTVWPSYDANSQQYIRFHGNMTSFPIESHYVADRFHFWNNFVPALTEACTPKCQSCDGRYTSGGHILLSTSLLVWGFLAFIACIHV